MYLGLDQMRVIITTANPSIRVRGYSDSGFFLDYTSDDKWQLRKRFTAVEEAIVNGIMDYPGAMRSIFTFMNISSGANPACIGNAKNQNLPTSLCMFAQNLAPHLTTPLFTTQVCILTFIFNIFLLCFLYLLFYFFLGKKKAAI